MLNQIARRRFASAAQLSWALAAVLSEQHGPRRAVLCADGGAGQQWLAAKRPYLAEMKPVGGRATAYVCENFACQAPVTTPAELRSLSAERE